ncbi:hypothetical protein EAH84_14700 [Sphingomonas oligophenolica]|uniref:Uncharacterized protein n=1 Tax=Sphingomonas oligophenolica TaxID=301154 RepID=A0A502C1P2_9SPHN|nr:hypothetical protein EAH84_14700 [Sphingomonas oligophenolica]
MDATCQATSVVLIDCVSTGRSPTVQELDGLAERIWIERGCDRSALAWGRLEASSRDRVMALRAALVSMSGSGA